MNGHVVHVTQPTTAGVGSYVRNLAIDQVRRGWQVTVVSPPDARFAAACAAAGATHVEWRAERSPGPGLPSEIRALARALDELDPALVFLHSSKAGLAGRLALRGRRPTVFCPHAWSFLAAGHLRHLVRLWERWAARWTTAYLCVSDAEWRRGHAAGVRGRAVVVPNGVDLDEFSPGTDEERAALRCERALGDGPVAVCVGRVCEQKGQDLLLRAWTSVLRAVPDATLVLVGDGPLRSALEAASSPGITWVGDRHDVRDWIVAADVAVQASRWDGASFVTLETMACGRSMVVTDVDGNRDALGPDDDAGAIVPPDDEAALASALIDRLRDPQLARAEGERARQRAMTFGLSAWSEGVAELVTALLGDGGR